MSDLIGKTLLNQFRVDAFVASGSMGAVYRVWDLKRNVSLAMKVLHAELAEDPSLFKRFQREARALQKLAHPNIVPFYGLYQTPEYTFLLERFIDGPSLKDILRNRQRKPLSVGEALIYMKALCPALGYAHANGVIHCDVKPGNVVVDHGGTIYLTDFGIARHADSTTTTLAGAGTAAYMAPEQIRSQAVTPATDIYAMGVILYEMLTGQRPFRGSETSTEQGGPTTNERIRYAHIHIMPTDPGRLNPSIPRSLSDVILIALEKNAIKRYQSAQAFFTALSSAAGPRSEGEPERVTLPGSLISQSSLPKQFLPIQEQIRHPSDRRRQISSLLLIAGLVLVIAILLLLAGSLGGTAAISPFPSVTELTDGPYLTSTSIVHPSTGIYISSTEYSSPTPSAPSSPTFFFTDSPTPFVAPSPSIFPTLPPGNQLSRDDPTQFIQWYFNAVWQDRDYQELWTYQTRSFQAATSPGGVTEYIQWWSSVDRADISAVNVLSNDGHSAYVEIEITFHLKNGKVLRDEKYRYTLIYDTNRQTWLFDYP